MTRPGVPAPPDIVQAGMPMKKPETSAPKEPERFFAWLRQASEACWKDAELKDEIYGFQIQAGTRWRPGLSDAEIGSFEKDMGFSFPPLYKLYLKAMNGTGKETVNIYGRSGEPERHGPGFYSYPGDLPKVRELIAWIYESCRVTPEEVEAQQIPHIVPIVAHRFLVVDRSPSNPVLSMYGDDIVAYASNLMAFLDFDIFHDSAPEPGLPGDLRVEFWLP
jgi:hypothetical protein